MPPIGLSAYWVWFGNVCQFQTALALVYRYRYGTGACARRSRSRQACEKNTEKCASFAERRSRKYCSSARALGQLENDRQFHPGLHSTMVCLSNMSNYRQHGSVPPAAFRRFVIASQSKSSRVFHSCWHLIPIHLLLIASKYL